MEGGRKEGREREERGEHGGDCLLKAISKNRDIGYFREKGKRPTLKSQ